MRTAIQQAIEYLTGYQQKAEDVTTQLCLAFAMICLDGFKGTEQQQIEAAFKAGDCNGGYDKGLSPTDYFTTTYKNAEDE